MPEASSSFTGSTGGGGGALSAPSAAEGAKSLRADDPGIRAGGRGVWRNTAQYGSSRPLFGGHDTLVFRFKTHTCFRFYRKEPLPPDAAVPREAGGQACAGEMGRYGERRGERWGGM